MYGLDWVNIHSCGNGHLWFRSYSGSLGKAPSNQGLLPLTFGASLWLGMPSLRSCSVGPPPSAIHGRGRLTRHPCRVAHYAEPALGLSMGQEDQKPKRGGLPADLVLMGTYFPVGASLLAMDVNDNARCLNDRVVQTFFASKLRSSRPRTSVSPQKLS
ncbi:hypothetical protein D3C84_541050 [compost metagenome]